MLVSVSVEPPKRPVSFQHEFDRGVSDLYLTNKVVYFTADLFERDNADQLSNWLGRNVRGMWCLETNVDDEVDLPAVLFNDPDDAMLCYMKFAARTK